MVTVLVIGIFPKHPHARLEPSYCCIYLLFLDFVWLFRGYRGRCLLFSSEFGYFLLVVFSWKSDFILIKLNRSFNNDEEVI